MGLCCLGLTAAQDTYTETVHAAVVFTRYGEQTPFILPAPPSLTPLGAQQLSAAGSFLRSRYIEPAPSIVNTSAPSTPIAAISPFIINNTQVYALAPGEEYVSNSAQAFVQGLYPPLNVSANVTAETSMTALANGSAVENPLGGYQYPNIYTVTSLDPNAVWITGDVNCPQYSLSGASYFETQEFIDTQNSTRSFYQGLESSILNGVFETDEVGYYNAFDIFDFVNYEYNHNSTVAKNLSSSDLAELRILSDRMEFAMNGNLSVSGWTRGDMIRAIAGRTLAARIAGLLTNNIQSSGVTEILSVMFGSYEPFLAFFSLAQLPQVSGSFNGLPDFGSSMVFELFSVGNATSFPPESDLMVRFLFRNGTSDTEDLISYPLFGRGHSESDMTWTDFMSGMNNIMLNDVGSWCDTCGSQEYFCAVYGSGGKFNATGPSGSGSRKSNQMSNQVAGVIGAAVTLGVLMISVAAAMLFGGMRFHRSPKRRSELGGFKGGEKLASDADLTSDKAADPSSGKGHERVGSWELKDNNSHNPNFGSLHADSSAHPGRRVDDDDVGVNPFAEPVKVEDRV